MNNFKIASLLVITRGLIGFGGGEVIQDIKDLVAINEDPNKTGDERRKAVITELREMGVHTAKWILNIAIAIVVSWYEINAKKA
jgi:hypothetical protein